MALDELLTVSASELARRIRHGRVTSRRVVETHIAQIRTVNERINAVVADRFEAAVAEAEDADLRVREADATALPPFHGVPFTVKECFAVAGMPHTAGMVARRLVRADSDATVVARMRAAGGIPLGVTNVSEACLWMESVNPVFGRTRNPYDVRRTAGGSSGGEAAIIGAGGSPIGIGSDIGGSIRGPAFFNGVFGHKPTGGLVPGDGQLPACAKGATRILCTGPIARRAEDLMPALRVFAGAHGNEPDCAATALRDPNEVNISALTVLNVPNNSRMRISDDLVWAQERALLALAATGAAVKTRILPALAHQFEMWSAGLEVVQEVPFATLLGDGTPVRPLRELGRWLLRRSPHTLMPLLTALTDPIPGLFPAQRAKFVEAATRLKRELMGLLGDNGIMLYPTYSTPAPRHRAPVLDALRLHFPFAHQGVFNILGFPSTAVPLGLNAVGLPLGCQVIAAPGMDHLTIAVAIHLERALGGWVAPPLPPGA